MTYFMTRSNLVTRFSMGIMKTVNFSETIAASDLKVGIYYPGFVCFVLY